MKAKFIQFVIWCLSLFSQPANSTFQPMNRKERRIHESFDRRLKSNPRY